MSPAPPSLACQSPRHPNPVLYECLVIFLSDGCPFHTRRGFRAERKAKLKRQIWMFFRVIAQDFLYFSSDIGLCLSSYPLIPVERKSDNIVVIAPSTVTPRQTCTELQVSKTARPDECLAAVLSGFSSILVVADSQSGSSMRAFMASSLDASAYSLETCSVIDRCSWQLS